MFNCCFRTDTTLAGVSLESSTRPIRAARHVSEQHTRCMGAGPVYRLYSTLSATILDCSQLWETRLRACAILERVERLIHSMR
jgi:hypothetical protein